MIPRPDASVDAAILGSTFCAEMPHKTLRDWLGGGDGIALDREIFRVLKPGGHVAAYSLIGHDADHHGIALRLAGFELRDSILWMWRDRFIPVILARKPLEGTVAENVSRHGVGALHIDASRITSPGGSPSLKNREQARKKGVGPGVPGRYKHTLSDRTSTERYTEDRPGELLGRWPSNLVHDGSDGVMAAFAAYGETKSPQTYVRSVRAEGEWLHSKEAGTTQLGFGDDGSVSRFFAVVPDPAAMTEWLRRLIAPEGAVVMMNPLGEMT